MAAASRPATRRTLQAAFLVLTVVGVFVVQGNAERWCPFGGLETVYTYVTEGNTLCSVGVSNLFVVVAVLASVLLLRRAFCSHVCPVGTLQEWMRTLGRRLGWRKPLAVPTGLDAALSLLKYAVLVFFLWITWQAGELLFRGYCPAYALLGRHGEDITTWAYVVSGGILVGGLFLTVPFCRWLCPLAAVMNPLAKVGLVHVARDPGSCADCGKCARACPMAIPVDEIDQIEHARCTACGECVSSCPTRGRGTLALRWRGATGRIVRPAVVAGLLLLVLGVGVAGATLFPLPSFRWSRGEVPDDAALLEMTVGELSCRGRANLFVYFLERDDDLHVEGPLRLEAWPSPAGGEAKIWYDPAQTDAQAIRAAIAEAYFDYDAGMSRPSPFVVPGYDPLDFE